MFICPTCNKEFSTEQLIQKHFLECWKEQHPFHVSKEAPHSANVISRAINDDVMDFFNSLGEK